MKSILATLVLTTISVQISAQDFPNPKPTDAHKVLAGEAGVWDADVKMYFQRPDGPPTKYKAVETPGGSRKPLASDPVLETLDDSGHASTPGLAVRFQTPVVNGPGPDVVFFDLQTFSNPPDGDAFHVSPLKFRDGLKSHTARVYDLTMESPAALDLADFQIHMFEETVQSLEMLETAECTCRSAGMKFRGLVVGIDLSDLGYDEGESVEGLFFQDTLDDQHIVDPVFIGGLPEVGQASVVTARRIPVG